MADIGIHRGFRRTVYTNRTGEPYFTGPNVFYSHSTG